MKIVDTDGIFPIAHSHFYFMRHGETDWNRQKMCMGHTDIPLNELGVQQAEQAAELLMLRGIGFNSIAASPLVRASLTAQIVAKKIPAPITIIDDLKECGWGCKEGQTVDLEQWVKGVTPDGAETVSDFTARVVRGFKAALKLPEPVLIVAHGGVYCAIQEAFKLPFQNLHNCAIILHQLPEQPGHPWVVANLNGGE